MGLDVLEEFWAFGFRNPWRMTLDPLTKFIWIGDVGDVLKEEVSVLRKGGNYQYPLIEGLSVRDSAVSPVGVWTDPVYDYGGTRVSVSAS